MRAVRGGVTAYSICGSLPLVQDMKEAGVLDPLFVVRHALSGSTEAAISVLRIDDVLWAKTDPSTPDWKDDEESEG